MIPPEPALLPLLATLLLPGEEVERLLGLAADRDASAAARLAAARSEGREPLLRALLRASRPAWTELRRRAARCAAGERPRLAGLLLRAGEGREPQPGVSPAIARLLRERLGSDGP